MKGTSARNPVPSEKDVKDISDNGNDLDGNSTDDPTILVLGLDSDGDGTPDSTDIDDDGDGILDRDEKCLTFLLDGTSFESYTGHSPLDHQQIETAHIQILQLRHLLLR